jgi:hypothetical protein
LQFYEAFLENLIRRVLFRNKHCAGLPNDNVLVAPNWWLAHTEAYLADFFLNFLGAEKFLIVDAIQFGAGVGSFLGETTVPLEPIESQNTIYIRGGSNKPLGAAWHDAFSRKMQKW